MTACEQLGLWKIGSTLQDGETFRVAACRPIDAGESPRWDYAIKFGETPQARSGLERTIAAAAMVTHPHLVPVLDADLVGERAYVVMPRLEGQTMAAHLQQSSPKRLPVALWLVRQVCQALDVLQQSGWTHGDVKPANVMIAENGHATLIDFAFAHRGTLIAGSPFEGTPDFAAPEVVVNPAARTPASDVFAAGRMLWEWLTRVETQDEAVLAPVCELVESMVAEDASHRPSAGAVVKELLRLEIDTLGEHIIPSAPQPIASRAA